MKKAILQKQYPKCEIYTNWEKVPKHLLTMTSLKKQKLWLGVERSEVKAAFASRRSKDASYLLYDSNVPKLMRFNHFYPVGAKVFWRPSTIDNYQELTVKTEAFISHNRSVVFFEEKPAFCSIDDDFIDYTRFVSKIDEASGFGF